MNKKNQNNTEEKLMAIELKGHRWKHDSIPQQLELETNLVHMIKSADDDGSAAFLATDICDFLKESNPRNIDKAVVRLKELSCHYHPTSPLYKYAEPCLVFCSYILGFTGMIHLISGEASLGIFLVIFGVFGNIKKQLLSAKFNFYLEKLLRKNTTAEYLTGGFLSSFIFAGLFQLLNWTLELSQVPFT